MSYPSADSEPATVRELIVQLAQVEDAMRQAAGAAPSGDTAALAEREQSIVQALHEHGLPFHAQGVEGA
ncbi:hypothetical protein [Sinomonas flava]|uniref:Uncharacterized protein n=1 Tax=Sinomonas flava TaxID=496857 RepID=A0ABN3C0F0_9MICC